MRVGVSIKPVMHIAGDLQEFLEALFAEIEDLKDVEVHANDLDKFTLFLLKLAEDFDIRYSVHCPHMYSEQKVNLCSVKESERQNARKWISKSIEYAGQLDAKYIVIHPDVPQGCTKEKACNVLKNHILENAKKLQKGQMLLIENMPGADYALSTPSEFEKFLRSLNMKEKTGICWDIGHEIVRFRKQEFLCQGTSRKPHHLWCGGSLSIQKTSACNKPRPLGCGGTSFF